MALKTIFKKPVDRTIEGVIKADDDESLRLEVEEYVITREVEKRLESFLDAYNNYDGANGVWVSGFFGSGKSHLLKILAMLMENREVEGVNVLDLFIPKCGTNEILRGDLKRAVAIPSKSILFNIDQKTDVISKTQIDALLAVFVKVFDETCGYYGKHPYIAQFERELAQDNLFQKFKDVFSGLEPQGWEWGRVRAKRVASKIDEAYQSVTGQNVSDILDKYRSDYRLSIEDFADQVNTYIQKQGKDFRLNFFVDEVGQYVAENVKLMTNLQTIAESLATKSRGRAWIIVTAQEDMNTVVGEMNKQQSNDFSKIQARFSNRMKLTSADVAEVIQKRLLMKNDDGIEVLSKVYQDQKNNFKTLFDFADGSQIYRNFLDRDHFIHAYPFIPYQFILFQSAIQNLSMHNAFEGKHRSVGERSMLGVFQQVAIQISDHEIGQLATFDLMFEGIRNALKAQIQRSIQLAEQNLDNKFAVQVLKALFLVKYIKEFKSTRRNLIVLMMDKFDQDMEQLNKKLSEALNLLEQQTYIQRNGDFYEFLTDEEKDIEAEIKNTDIETSAVSNELSKIVFDNIIKQKKIRYPETNHDYPFSRKLDDKLCSREQELTIHIISSFHEHADDEQTLCMQSMGRDELLVIMPPDERMMRDLLMYEKTNKYIRQNMSTTQREAVKRILSDRTIQNQERHSDLKQHISTLLGKAKLFINGSALDIGGEDPQARITQGFYELITRTYPNLKMLLGFPYTESYISNCLNQAGETLFGNDVTMMSEAEQEMLSVVKSNKNTGVRTTLKTLIDRFERKSYGWYYAAILCTLAKLCAAGKVELSFDSNIIEENQLQKALLNHRDYGNTVIEPLIDFTAVQLRDLKDFYQDFFDCPPKTGEAKALGNETITAFKELIDNLTKLSSEKSRYPFLFVLDDAISKLNEFKEKPYIYFITELYNDKEDLLDLKESIIDPVRRFMSGPLKTILKDSTAFIEKHDANFSYIEGDELQQIKTIHNDPDCYKGNKMQQVKTLVESLKTKINEQLKITKNEASVRVNTLLNKMIAMDDFSKLDSEKQKEIKKPFEEFIQKLEAYTLIPIINDSLRRFENDEYLILLNKMSKIAIPEPTISKTEPKPEDGDPPPTGGKTPSGYSGTATTTTKDPKVKEEVDVFVAFKKITIEYKKACVEDENDVEEYLSVLRDAMMKEILLGKKVRV